MCCLRTASMDWNVPGKYGPHGELFFFLTQKEPATEQVGETLSPLFSAHIFPSLFSAGVLKKCALLALHTVAEEVPGLGNEWKMGCPKSPMWEGEGEAWSEDEAASSTASREGNVSNEVLHVIGLCGAGDKVSLFL